jgi:hypothetical protein
MVDLVAKKRFIERKEDDLNSTYSNLLCCISTLHKEIVLMEDEAKSLVMKAIPEELQAVCADV